MTIVIGLACLAGGFVGGMWWGKNRAKVAAAAIADAQKLGAKVG